MYYVTSTRNNVKKYLEATYDEEKGVFITSGYFDENNHDYVPGTISVEYTKKISPVTVDSNYDWDIFDEQVAAGTADSVTFKETTETDCVAQIDLGSIYPELGGVAVDTLISIYDENTDGNLSDWLGVFKDYENLSSYVVPGKDNEKYLVSMDYSDPYSYAVLVRDITESKFIKLILKTAMDDATSPGETDLNKVWTLTKISETLSTTGTIAKTLFRQHEIETNMDELREEIWSTPYATSEQRQEALRQVNLLEKDQLYFMLLTTALPLIVEFAPLALGATMAAPGILFTAILGTYIAMAPVFWEIRTGYIKGDKFAVNSIVDPSGYVYDASTKERLMDVKVTAYCIPYDDSDDFWDNAPDPSEYGNIWDAGEYDQANPLYTNVDGKYAWYVPEGWWRVKYEKAGYETTWSEWLPVPPPQTEVNIGMVPIEEEEEDVHIHNLTLVPAVEATPAQDGHKAYYICSGCDDWFEDATGTKIIIDKSSVIIKKTGNTEVGNSPQEPTTNITDPVIEKIENSPQESITNVKNPVIGEKIFDVYSNSYYRITNNIFGNFTVEYIKSSKTKTKVNIPTTVKINGTQYKVTSIANNAFKNNKKIKKIVIPTTIERIGKKAFFNCENLKNIVIKTKKLKKNTIGKKAFKGISAKAVIKVPKVKRAMYQKILGKKGIGNKNKIK